MIDSYSPSIYETMCIDIVFSLKYQCVQYGFNTQFFKMSIANSDKSQVFIMS